MTSEELKPEKNHGLDQIVEQQEDQEEEQYEDIYFECRKCGEKHQYPERPCEDGESA